MHIGALCPSSPGHINPMATLCRELASRGHRVTVLVPPDGERRARSFGLDVRLVSAREFPPGTLDAALERLGTLSGRPAARLTVELYLRGTLGSFRDVPRAIDESGIEGLIADQTSGTGRSVAEHAGIPFVTLCAALMLNAEPGVPPHLAGWPYRDSHLSRLRNRLGHAVFRRQVRTIRKVVAEQRRAWGLPPLRTREENDSALAQLVQTPRAFEYPRRDLPSQMHFVGPLHDVAARREVPFDHGRLDGRPLVYASMGSLQNKLPRVFEIIAQACDGLDAQLVLSFGRDDAVLPDDLPGSPVAVAYAPQLDLIRRASLVVTHAGLNTAMESLACGVPMVAIPITNDQPGVAARIAWTGTGEVLPLGRLSAERLRPRIRALLEDSSYRANAARMRDEIRLAGGVPRAADIVEHALRERKPVPAVA